MIDYGTRHTDLALKRLEARLRAVYRQAEKDIAAKTADYWKRHAARDEKYRQQVKDGKLSKEDYEAWQRGQVFQGKQWESKRQSIEDVLYNADSTALQMINDGKMDVFTAGANYMGYELEQHGRIDTGFNLYDGPTVTRLLKDNPQILPKARVKKEKAYVWYNKLVNNCVLQGIIQGESIGEIAERIGKTTGERTRTAMLRNARTAYTGAQNAGRLEGMRQAEKLGVNVKKRWMATLDARTRDAHADLDGQVQDRDKPFKSPLGDIMFPGDPTAKPGNVYNCRCTITYVYPEYASTMTRRDNESGEVVGDMTYREWEQMKRRDNETGEIIDNMTYREWEEMKRSRRAESEKEQNAPIAKVIEYGDLFPDDVGQITRDTLDDLNREYPISRELEYVGDVRTHRGLDPDVDIFDLHNEYPNLNNCGAQYLARGADGKSGPCIEIHKESYSTQKLQDEFDERYALRLKYGDPMQPPKPGDAFYTVSDTFEGTIRHEYGHALSDDKGVFGGGQDNSFRKWQKEYWETHRAELPAISQYAASHPDEMFAEAFVQAQDTRHPETLAYKLSREIMDAFERYMRGEPL